MSRTAPSSQNTLTVYGDDGTVIGTLLVSVAGFIAFTATGKSLADFSTMQAAIAALESAAGK